MQNEENTGPEIVTGIKPTRKHSIKKNSESRINIQHLLNAYQEKVQAKGGPLDSENGECPAIRLPAKKVQNHRAMKKTMNLPQEHGVDLRFLDSGIEGEYFCIMVPAKTRNAKAKEEAPSTESHKSAAKPAKSKRSAKNRGASTTAA